MSTLRGSVRKHLETASTLLTSHLMKTLKDNNVSAELSKSYVAAFRILVGVGTYPCTKIEYMENKVYVYFKDNDNIDKYHVTDILSKGGIPTEVVKNTDLVKTKDLLVFINNTFRTLLLVER